MKNLFLVLAVLLCSCSSPSLLVKTNARIHRLGIDFDASEQSIPYLAREFSREVDSFISWYNQQPERVFDVYRAAKRDSTTLRIRLVATRLVSPSQQTTAVLVSLAGLSLPFVLIASGAEMVLVFAYFPQVRSLTELSLSEDIHGNERPKNDYILTSPGFLTSVDKQLSKHVIAFNRLLAAQVREISGQKKKSALREQKLARR